MKETTDKLDRLVTIIKEYLSRTPEAELSFKANPQKWSKKEIIGHLIDSGINNTKRFTSVLIEKEPFRIHPMRQVELVKVNDYQHTEVENLLALLVSINNQIKKLMLLQKPKTLATKIELYTEGNFSDLKYLMEDYVEHFEQHVHQIVTPVTN